MRRSRAFRLARSAVALLLLAGLSLGAAHVLGSTPARSAASPRARLSPSTPSGRRIPGLGPLTASQIPRDAEQVLLVSGDGRASGSDLVSLWARRGSGWTKVAGGIGGRNGALGWTAQRRAGDGRTPIGVFGLTQAGGALPNPGTDLPYEHDPTYFGRSMYLGNEATSVFDYVVAINFNRVAGAPPSDSSEPLGPAVGGGIWLHVGNGQATAGCVAIPRSDMVLVLRWLEPRLHPVVVMGDRSSLAV